MIPTIVLILLRRYQKTHPDQFLAIKARLIYTAKLLLILAAAFALALISNAQERVFSYTIKRNGSKVGRMDITQVTGGSRTTLKLQSEVKTRFIFSFSAKATEEAVFDNGIMVSSFVYQKLNGKEKLDKLTRYVNNSYIIKSDGGEERLNARIHYNLICLYAYEPINNRNVYSDKYETFLPIEKIEAHHYKIKFPDGSFNEYWYEKGICIKVKIEHALYSATIELNR
jgi:hypothetical protein